MKIAVASGKGGTGKTTLSTNLAAYISRKQPVVLLDLDVEEPNSGLFIEGRTLHTAPVYRSVPTWRVERCTMCGLCQDVCNFNAVLRMGEKIMLFPQLCHSCFACSELCPASALPMVKREAGVLTHRREDSLDFVECRLNVGEEQAVPLIKESLRFTEEQFDQAALRILDSPPGTACPMVAAVKEADLVLLISEPTPFGLHDFRISVETLRQLGLPFAAVINRDGIGDDALSDYCEEEGIPVAGRIPNSREVAERYSDGKLVYESVPSFRSALEDIVAYIEGASK